ncbi:MAG: hypothetical protein KC620_11275 [Myxococcales bacterium]|nr:hypothetical protein [Myxococcales bacterium]
MSTKDTAKAAEREEAVEEEREEEQEEAGEEEKRQKAEQRKFHQLFQSPAQRLSMAFGLARVPLDKLLAPHVVQCHYRFDGQVDLVLDAPVTLRAADLTLSFAKEVHGTARHGSLVDLRGVGAEGGETAGRVSALSANGHSLEVHVEEQDQPLGCRFDELSPL